MSNSELSNSLFLNKIRSDPGNYNFIFLPGGPGLSGEYLKHLALNLDLTGNTFIGDFPGCGLHPGGFSNLEGFKQALIQSCGQNENVILIAHSFAGMLVLSTPELQSKISACILLNTTPFFNVEQQNTHIREMGLPSLKKSMVRLLKAPSDEAYAQYFQKLTTHFGFKNSKQAKSILENISYNVHPFLEAWYDFLPNYKNQWVPDMPTLILGGQNDHYIPFDWFLKIPEFQQKNIILQTVPDAGHFCWVDNMLFVQQAIMEFKQKLT